MTNVVEDEERENAYSHGYGDGLRDGMGPVREWLRTRDAAAWSPGWSEAFKSGYDTAVEEVRAFFLPASGDQTGDQTSDPPAYTEWIGRQLIRG